MIVAAAGLGGALFGATAIFLLEFWRQVLSARSAARIIRMELQGNSVLCLMAITYKQHQHVDQFLDKAWNQFGIHLAPLLPDQALLRLSNNYRSLFIVRTSMQQIATDHERAKAEIGQWLTKTQLTLVLLKQIEKRRRAAQFIDLMLGRITFPPGVVDDKGQFAPNARLIEKVVEDLQEVVKAEADREAKPG